MDEISDSELIMLILEENEDAKNILYNRYKYIIDIVTKKYSKVVYKLGLDYGDFYSEGLCGFSGAIYSYNQDKSTSLATFITLCVERCLKKYLLKANRLKNLSNRDTLSLDYIYDNTNLSLQVIFWDERNEPLKQITKQENYLEFISFSKKELSPFEYTVLTLMIDECSSLEIARILHKSSKQIYNTMQRVREKLKKNNSFSR